MIIPDFEFEKNIRWEKSFFYILIIQLRILLRKIFEYRNPGIETSDGLHRWEVFIGRTGCFDQKILRVKLSAKPHYC
jgi:hypothetical protein